VRKIVSILALQNYVGHVFGNTMRSGFITAVQNFAHTIYGGKFLGNLRGAADQNGNITTKSFGSSYGAEGAAIKWTRIGNDQR
jgi:hypothetical protein